MTVWLLRKITSITFKCEIYHIHPRGITIKALKGTDGWTK